MPLKAPYDGFSTVEKSVTANASGDILAAGGAGTNHEIAFVSFQVYAKNAAMVFQIKDGSDVIFTIHGDELISDSHPLWHVFATNTAIGYTMANGGKCKVALLYKTKAPIAST